MPVRTLVCVRKFTAVRLRLMEGQDSLVGAREQVCAGILQVDG